MKRFNKTNKLCKFIKCFGNHWCILRNDHSPGTRDS